MGMLSQRLKPPKARLNDLMEELNRLEARALRAAPMSVIRVCRCNHPECGEKPPSELPEDALVIDMGCRYLIPSVELPNDIESQYRSRVERGLPARSTGLGPEGVRATIQLIHTLNR